MLHEPKHFTITDPRTAEGDPYEVAERAVAQLEAVVRVASEAAPLAVLMVRNAELSRQQYRGQEPDGLGWPDTAEGRKWTDVVARLRATVDTLAVLRRVAAFNPAKPPKV
jgi:hypothetical protein